LKYLTGDKQMTITETRPNVYETASDASVRDELFASYDGYTTAERLAIEEQTYRVKTELQPRLDWQQHLENMAKYCGNIVLGEE
jgi:hypothetical protein